MKNFKFVPVLAIAALLSACGVNKGISVKAPKFAKEGAEVTYAEFGTKLEAAIDASELADAESKLGDTVISAKQTQSQVSVLKNGKKELSREEQKVVYEDHYKFDADNLLGESSSSFKVYGLQSDVHGEKTQEEKEEESYRYQFGEGDESKYLYRYELETKYFYEEASVADGDTQEHLFNICMKEEVYNSISTFFGLMPTTETEASSYKFYVNGNVFTFVDSYDESGNMTDDVSNVYGTYADKGELKVQLDLTNGVQKLKVAMEVTETGKYTAAYGSYGEGDEVKAEYKMYMDNSVQSKKVSLKAIDASEFVPNPII